MSPTLIDGQPSLSFPVSGSNVTKFSVFIRVIGISVFCPTCVVLCMGEDFLRCQFPSHVSAVSRVCFSNVWIFIFLKGWAYDCLVESSSWLLLAVPVFGAVLLMGPWLWQRVIQVCHHNLLVRKGLFFSSYQALVFQVPIFKELCFLRLSCM